MKDGFIKVIAESINVCVANTEHNTAEILKAIDNADALKSNILLLPELCITGYTCGDLFFSETLLLSAQDSLIKITEYTKGKYPVIVVGAPVLYRCKLYNCAVVIHNGNILGIVPKQAIPNYGEFYEKRQFSSLDKYSLGNVIDISGEKIPFGNDIVFCNEQMRNYTFGIEICEDLWTVAPPSEGLCRAGATIILNPSASDEVIGKEDYRRLLVKSTSARLICGYAYANAGYTESTQDMVFSSHHIIAENGTILAENKPFDERGIISTEFDVNHLVSERHKNTEYINNTTDEYRYISFSQSIVKTALTRHFEKNPFVPSDDTMLNERAEAILKIQSYGLARRISHTNAGTIVVGVSGGLDSTLALLVMARAMDILKRPRNDIHAITMPCFGTTRRTNSNSHILCECLGVTLKEIDITKAVNQHFEDIGQSPDVYDVTFENSQARERTQILMDYANKTGGFVVGTGDLSELALGWATYNGDHMSMYGVNTSVPKTLVRYIVRYEMLHSEKRLAEVLEDILDTPVSPELLPVDEKGEMTQRTEDLVGPYELHDFFLYHMVKFGSSPSKIFRIAKIVFENEYDEETIKKWLKIFVRRFFNQQFKRSCMPDGPKVGSVTLSPRGDWRMPSDASSQIWLKELECL